VRRALHGEADNLALLGHLPAAVVNASATPVADILEPGPDEGVYQKARDMLGCLYHQRRAGEGAQGSGEPGLYLRRSSHRAALAGSESGVQPPAWRRTGIAAALNNLGNVARSQGDYTTTAEGAYGLPGPAGRFPGG
jgi:hypothetical protein